MPDIEHRSTTCKKSTISPASLVIFIKQNGEDNNNNNNNYNDIVLIINALYYFWSYFKYLVYLSDFSPDHMIDWKMRNFFIGSLNRKGNLTFTNLKKVTKVSY